MKFEEFIQTSKFPLVVVSTLPRKYRQQVINFLFRLKLPVYLEGVSGLREDPQLADYRITYIHDLWKNAASLGYPIDGVLRIGGVPTLRPWRDLEDKQD